MPYCIDCGTDIPAGSANCPGCGVDLRQTPPQEEYKASLAPYVYGIAGILFGVIFSPYGIIIGLAKDPFGIFVPVVGFILGVYGIYLANLEKAVDDRCSIKLAVCAIAIVSSVVFTAAYIII